MKKKILLIAFAVAMLFTITGCGESQGYIKEKEVILNSSYILDYENKNWLGNDEQAYMIVVFNISPEKDILLDDTSMSMIVGNETINGYKYENEKIDIIYDSKSNIKLGDSGKLAYIFKMEKYLYKGNDTFNVNYKVGTKKGEYSYIIEDTLSFNKDSIEEVDYLEDIVKGVYKDKSNDVLMILSLKWKIRDVYEKAEVYDKLDFYNQTNYQCYNWGARKIGEKIQNYFAENTENIISISNRGYLNVGSTAEPEKKYDLPELNYNTLEKYYPGIKEPLTELSNLTNEYANGLINVNDSGSDECYRDINIKDIKIKAKIIDNILNNN